MPCPVIFRPPPGSRHSKLNSADYACNIILSVVNVSTRCELYVMVTTNVQPTIWLAQVICDHIPNPRPTHVTDASFKIALIITPHKQTARAFSAPNVALVSRVAEQDDITILRLLARPAGVIVVVIL